MTDAQVVSRRDTFAGHITLLFGHYNGVGIYLIDAPHLYDRPGSPYHDTNLFAYTDNVLRFALLGWVGAEMASGLTHSGVLMWCMRTTGMQALRLRICGARASGEVGVYCAQPGLSRHVLCTSHE